MSGVNRDKTLALAAVFQAAGLVNDLARRGQCDSEAEAFLLRSVLVMDTDVVSDIYPQQRSLTPGLTWLEGSLAEQGKGSEHAGELIRLALAVIQVERHFEKRPDLQQALRQRLEQVQRQSLLQTDMSASALAQALAGAYVDHLGSLRFRIQVRGDARHLQSPGMAERVRAILLAGVRAAWLWHRLGGRRWHLVFTRGQILGEIRAIAKSV